MDKNAIKKYAVWARRELIERVAKKAQQFGIEKQNIVDGKADTINDKILTASEKRQRQALIARIKEKEKDGYEQVMEEVAYTWFNRFSALRFMEVNGYLPTHVRVFTDEENNFKPQILMEAIHLEMDGLDMEKVYALKDANKTDELYKYLLITQCNALNSILPGMFQKIEDYTELLFPDNLLREGSVIEQMVALIPEEDWKDAVQIIGWLYQYYNSEKKDDVFAALKRNVKITKENIPAATQLFTPDWIVRYMVENSLGRLWLEGHPNDELKSCWMYYLDEAVQDDHIQTQLDEIRKEYARIRPEDIKCIDPCSGSGHILVYMFDVLMAIYEAYGYTNREAVVSIVENNLYGLDIDERAAQLASFAVMMKARQYDRRFFTHVVQPHVYVIKESNHVDNYTIEYFCNGNRKLAETIHIIIEELNDANEYGSILNVKQQDWAMLHARFDEIMRDIHFCRELAISELLPIIMIAEILAQKYHVVVTNPPYMSSGGMNAKLQRYIKKNYPNSKSDLYAVFIERCATMISKVGFCSMITQHTWMFLSRYEKMRNCFTNGFVNLLHLGARAFDEISGEVVQTAAFVMNKSEIPGYMGKYIRVVDYSGEIQKEKAFHLIQNTYLAKQNEYMSIPGSPIAYWVSKNELQAFSNGKLLKDVAAPRVGAITGNNDRFIKYWWEVDFNEICFDIKNYEESVKCDMKWYPYNKGGSARKWYGNRELIVFFRQGGIDIVKNAEQTKCFHFLGSQNVFFHEGITWNGLASNRNTFRYSPVGTLFDSNKGPMLFTESVVHLKYLMALFNTKVTQRFISIFNPSISLQAGDFEKMPVIFVKDKEKQICELCEDNIKESCDDWNSIETSWDFSQHPLLSSIEQEKEIDNSISSGNAIVKLNDLRQNFEYWKRQSEERFTKIKTNEKILNSIFIDIYGLQSELSDDVEDKEITVRKADLQNDIKSLISFAVGCMFGRYSLDHKGLVYAGGEWDNSKYVTYPADKDNIIPICDDEYFEDDIASRFINIIEVVYGKNTLQENLKFIADALGGKGQPKEVIRGYFLNNFYKDHCKVYQKRPIYWQFDSGKKNGFKCLIYMHRYEQDTIARIRTDYVHEQQSRYRTAIEDLEQQIMNAGTSERVKLNKKLLSLQAQASEIRAYEEKIHHLADQMIRIDLDDGVKKNYEKFKDVLAKIN